MVKNKSGRPKKTPGGALLLYMWRWFAIGESLWYVQVCGMLNSVSEDFFIMGFCTFLYVNSMATFITFVIIHCICILSCSCSHLIVTTCQVIGWKDASDETSNESRRLYL